MAQPVRGVHLGEVPGLVEIVDDVPAAFASVFIEAYSRRRSSHSRFTVALSGGPTARSCYERLAEQGATTVDWSLVDIVMGDERCVSAEDPDANQRLVREALLERVAPVGSFHPMSCEDGPKAYERVLRRLEVIDLVHLGLGPDGHTASLFEGSKALNAPPGCLAMLDRDPNERNPHARMTLTLEAIARSRKAVFTVAGQAKHAAFSAVASGFEVPGAKVRARSVLWIVDPPAAGAYASI